MKPDDYIRVDRGLIPLKEGSSYKFIMTDKLDNFEGIYMKKITSKTIRIYSIQESKNLFIDVHKIKDVLALSLLKTLLNRVKYIFTSDATNLILAYYDIHSRTLCN